MHKNTLFERNTTLNCRGNILSLGKVKIMGILNITPDSFYDGGQYLSKEKAYAHISKMINDGADIIDIGAMSSRPGAELVSPEDEIERLKIMLDGLVERFSEVFFSIDTIYAETAEFAMQEGLHIINDISGGKVDAEIMDVAAAYNAPYILMHMNGLPNNMQNNVQDTHIMPIVIDYFIELIEVCKNKGVNDIILDPGIGFGKSLNDNFKILNCLTDFDFLNLPLLIGISRKSLITKLLNVNKHNSLNSTSILNFYSILNGANILRVHDVKEAREAVILAEQIMKTLSD